MKMASSSSSSKPSKSKQIPFFLSILILLFAPLLFIALDFRPLTYQLIHPLRSKLIDYRHFRGSWNRDTLLLPEWFMFIKDDMDVDVDVKETRKMKIGLVNVDDNDESFYPGLKGLIETVRIKFDPVPETLQWKNLFPQWIDEEEKHHRPSCPVIPMPNLDDYNDLDVIVVRSPCGSSNNSKEGERSLERLQVNLVVANLAVASGLVKPEQLGRHRTVHVVFIGSCSPMVEIFRCDDLVRRRVGDYWLYKPDQGKLKQKVLMPVGSCQLASSLYNAVTGDERSMNYSKQKALGEAQPHNQRQAYVTVLHSSEAYVCGAIALAQSIIRTNSTRDLVLLADDSITNKSRSGLVAAGWKVITIQRIRSPDAQKGAYNEWNYSKLRVWQLTQYDKVIFIDADFIVLENIDEFFTYPQLSAAGNNRVLFNSGIMVLEPSTCLFEELLLKTFELGSYHGGDQGFLNEFFTWWHRLPRRLNFLKYFKNPREEGHTIPENLIALHFLGTKPWMCYRDYDCNWDRKNHHVFASDMANEKWWEVYDFMPKELQGYCGLTKKVEFRIRKWRGKAKNISLDDGHWKIKVTDPRRLHLDDE